MAEAAPGPPGRASAGGRRRAFRWRPWLRALHRDVGYFAVGLTFIYALSGLAVNHVADWEPNFSSYSRQHQLEGSTLSAAGGDRAKAAVVTRRLGISEPVREVYRSDARTLEVTLDHSTLRIDTATGAVLEEGREPRFFLRVANWLHLNRGKKAWTYIADAYAGFLLLLSVTGLWMFPGRRGIFGRAGLIAAAGAAVPALYVTLSGGP